MDADWPVHHNSYSYICCSVATSLGPHDVMLSWNSIFRLVFALILPHVLFSLPSQSSTVHSSTPLTDAPTQPSSLLVIMDGFCPYHGAFLANRAYEKFSGSVAVVPVVSDYLRGFLQRQDSDSIGGKDTEESVDWDQVRVPQTDEEWNAWTDQFIPAEGVDRIAVYCESDSGLEQAEYFRQQLRQRLPDQTRVLGDSPHQMEARRNKYLMNKLIAEKTDLHTARQKLCSSVEETWEFAKELLIKERAPDGGDRHVVIKPYRGVASESVALCSSKEDVESAWKRITSSTVFGSLSRAQPKQVLVQEKLIGTEYAVDVVSCAGEYKVAAVWRYDKRPANGAPFCYYQTKLVDSSSDPNVSNICEYVKKTLAALGIEWGISHNEVIVTDSQGPKLVEVNCRQHNMDFLPLTMACIGYNVFEMLLEGTFGVSWNEYPELPQLRSNGCMVHLVSSARGHLVRINHLKEISEMSSLLDMEIYEEYQTPGALIEPTVDIRTDAGWIQLINENDNVLNKDYEDIVRFMPTMFETVDDGQDDENP